MKRFISKLLIFVFPIILLIGIIEHELAYVPNNYTLKRAQMEKEISEAEILMTGSSHAYFGIKPQLLGRPAFSLAYVSQDLYYDSHLLIKVLPQARKCKLVIIPLSYFSFETILDDSPEAWRTPFYTQVFDIPDRSRTPKIGDYSRIAMYGLTETRTLALSGFRNAQVAQFDGFGGTADVRLPNYADVLNGKSAVDRHNAAMKVGHLEENVRRLEEMLDALKARSIQAVLITTPCFHTYYDNLDPDAYRRMVDRVQAVSQKYRVEYYDYMRDSRFTASDFADSDHLDSQGADKFTRILRDEGIAKHLP